ncbi:hypothetical protein GCM10010271_03320 [Streptomyces kurssanovii]|nr:hypothetical protein GCM10010271_03320 [Streptomyces kurssanovii]
MVAAGHSIDPTRGREVFEVAMGRIARRFARVGPRPRAGRLVLGLLSDLPRENCWMIAEWAGQKTPHGMQHLLCRASWDADAVRDEAAVLVVDETGSRREPGRNCPPDAARRGTAATTRPSSASPIRRRRSTWRRRHQARSRSHYRRQAATQT